MNLFAALIIKAHFSTLLLISMDCFVLVIYIMASDFFFIQRAKYVVKLFLKNKEKSETKKFEMVVLNM